MIRLTRKIKNSKLAVLFFCGFVAASGLLMACITLPPPPVEQYALARAAIDAAKLVDAGRYSPGYFHKAELSYRNAQLAYEERDYDLATEEFRHARDYAERAENSARLIRFKNGDVL